MSFKPEVIADGSGQWCGNALRFGTREEAEANARDLANRWMSVTDHRAAESSDPINSAWVEGRLVRLVAANSGGGANDTVSHNSAAQAS